MKENIDKLQNKIGDVALRRRSVWIVNNLKLHDDLKILDVGCGDGFYLYLLSNLPYKKIKLFGLDNNEKALRSAKTNLVNNGNVKLIYHNASKLPFKNNTFDRILASEVLEHLEDDLVALKEIRRVLKPGGVFVCSVPNINYPFFWDPINYTLQHLFKTHIKSGFFAGIWNQHIKLYSDNNLLNVLKSAGYKNIHLAKLTHYCLPFNHYLINLVARILSVSKNGSQVKKDLSKFSKSRQINPLFKIVYFIDKLNDRKFNNKTTVSLVGYAKK